MQVNLVFLNYSSKHEGYGPLDLELL